MVFEVFHITKKLNVMMDKRKKKFSSHFHEFKSAKPADGIGYRGIIKLQNVPVSSEHPWGNDVEVERTLCPVGERCVP